MTVTTLSALIVAVIGGVVGAWATDHFSSHIDKSQFEYLVAKDARDRANAAIENFAASRGSSESQGARVRSLANQLKQGDVYFERDDWPRVTRAYNEVVLNATNCEFFVSGHTVVTCGPAP